MIFLLLKFQSFNYFWYLACIDFGSVLIWPFGASISMKIGRRPGEILAD